jgi:hypothetical protein
MGPEGTRGDQRKPKGTRGDHRGPKPEGTRLTKSGFYVAKSQNAISGDQVDKIGIGCDPVDTNVTSGGQVDKIGIGCGQVDKM